MSLQAFDPNDDWIAHHSQLVHDVNISLGAEGPNKVILILVPDNKVVSTLGPERETHLKPDPLTVNSDIK